MLKNDDKWKKKVKAKWLSKDHLKNKYSQLKNSSNFSKISHSFGGLKRKIHKHSFKREAKASNEREHRAEAAPESKAAEHEQPRVEEPNPKSQSGLNEPPRISEISKQEEQKKETQTLKYSFKESKNYKDYLIKITSVSSPMDSIRDSKVKTLKRYKSSRLKQN